MNGSVTRFGSFAASTGASTTAPRRAIGTPSAESSVRLGAVIGWSDFDSGAVTNSSRTSARKAPTMPTAAHLSRLRVIHGRSRSRRRCRERAGSEAGSAKFSVSSAAVGGSGSLSTPTNGGGRGWFRAFKNFAPPLLGCAKPPG